MIEYNECKCWKPISKVKMGRSHQKHSRKHILFFSKIYSNSLKIGNYLSILNTNCT